ncbi:putative arabinose efflux permease, MFS family [Streptoalloteichus tenebrarius]|uniref:Arabinose efflux permease, MFS family n=1 Tax=Streptoalloteichus tenebrarius (strain ATCC 17920 / DSM 40477 / JCM 4838 / CBS 697.72 / NBRC 16177 / NCIMB 11028 / NRRL B-12390 / A12253. 1 / ISP 5477) TaxID=1933 RepID=A0ABT1HWC5_STRSD|nr:MFS transporter [Streptoalloteichus tenebrarius]MCP2259818.1 putative arabinose efflux permease, MFS family [Streptoalloteichus tenebrarius]BFE99233.1 MFS transporter [Streptoalloteichus tenebrarius]
MTIAKANTSSTARDLGARSPAPAWRFWASAYSLLVLLTGTNLPTPLYRGYQQDFGFSPLVVTLVFAVYVGALVPSLLVAGPLSDAVGRRRVLLPAIALATVGAAAFALASGVAWLFVARVFQGLALGAASGTLTAAITEFEPRGDRRRAALVTTVVSVGGLGAGPLVAGVLAEYAPAPRVLPFALEIVLLVVAAVLVAAMPETRPPGRWRPRRPQVPAEARRVFLTSGAASFLAFAVVGLALSLVPTYVTRLSGSDNLVLAGGAVALMLACSSVAQVMASGRASSSAQVGGLAVLAVGLVLLAVAGSVSSLVLLLLAAMVSGAGHGLAFLGGLTEVNRVAPPDRRADVLSSFYVIVYLGVGVPVIGVGFLATRIGLLPSVQCFVAVVALLCLVVAVLLTVSARRAAASTSR